MIHLFLAAALAAAPAPAATPVKDAHADHQTGTMAGCEMNCCKDGKPMSCCEKMKAAKKSAEVPVAEGHGAHAHHH